MNKIEELAVLTALKKTIDERLKAVRVDVDEDMREAYQEDGIERKALRVGGQKVGNIIACQTKEDYEIVDRDAFDDFALSNGFATYVPMIHPECMGEAVMFLQRERPDLIKEEVRYDDWKKYAEKIGDAVVIADTDTVIPGVEYVPPHLKSTQVRGCDPKDVVPIIRQIGGVDQLLLGAGNE